MGMRVRSLFLGGGQLKVLASLGIDTATNGSLDYYKPHKTDVAHRGLAAVCGLNRTQTEEDPSPNTRPQKMSAERLNFDTGS